MNSKTNEKALEDHIEQALLQQGFLKGYNQDFDKQKALDKKRFWDFLETTQADELSKLKRDPNYKAKVEHRLDSLIKKHGVLHLLKNTFDVEDAVFTLFYRAPIASSGDLVRQRFESNQFSVTRQVTFSTSNPLLEIDMVLFINGLPIVTMELKNQWTGQSAKVQGIEQYKRDRDPKEPLLNFGRCLVHFTLDTDEVFMTTKLDGNNTFFLPFNKGNHCGAGNPINPNGYKTAYLWEEIFTKFSLADIIEHFMLHSVQEKANKKNKENKEKKETLFFPRYHQLDVVRRLIADVSQNGIGQTYLIQHSAGSGKSNSITWTAFSLIEAYYQNEEKPLFDSVIIVTDRKLLDEQLRQNVKLFSEQKNIVAPVFYSSELKNSLESGKKIILTTIQKFPFIVDEIANLSHKNFAVIIDEAHSSQSGQAHNKMNESMGKEEQEFLDVQEIILNSIRNRKMKSNVSYFAFTATPKNSTLEKFGQVQSDGSFKPFHLYSMKQAIEEGFILDVLSNYTTYRSYYELIKSTEENPLFNLQKAQKKLKNFVEKNPTTISTKVDMMLEHFMESIIQPKRLKGKAKAMIVTSNIESAILYFNAVQAKLTQLGNPFKAIVAFSGKKNLNGIEYTEEILNQFPSKEIAKKFEEDDYKILIVANKFLTGFDQPKLCAMYIDKKLQGVLAVQALSRLNRSANKYGKKTEDLFILDFANSVDDIQHSFEPFYTSTRLTEATDVNVLHDLKDSLEEVYVYEQADVDAFFERFFNNEEATQLAPIIDKAAERFNQTLELTEDEKIDFKVKAKQFIKLYGKMCAILPYEIIAWEKLFWFLKFLTPKLSIQDSQQEQLDELLNSVDLSTYGILRVKLGATIQLSDQKGDLKPVNSNPHANYDESAKENLSMIVDNFNQRWFTGWNETPEDQKERFLRIIKKVKNHPDYEVLYKNNQDMHTRNIALDSMIEEVMNQNRQSEMDIYKLYNDKEFQLSLRNNVAQFLNSSHLD